MTAIIIRWQGRTLQKRQPPKRQYLIQRVMKTNKQKVTILDLENASVHDFNPTNVVIELKEKSYQKIPAFKNGKCRIKATKNPYNALAYPICQKTKQLYPEHEPTIRFIMKRAIKKGFLPKLKWIQDVSNILE